MLSEKVLQVIRAESIRNYGIHSVAEWDEGGSDAVDLPIHTKAEFRKEFPKAKTEDVTDFFDGKRDGFVADYDSEKGITYTIYHCVDVAEDGEVVIHDADGEIVIARDSGEVPIEIMIANWLDVEELNKLCQGLARILSSLDIGEKEAWKLVCHIESKAIDALQAKHDESETPKPITMADVEKSNLITSL